MTINVLAKITENFLILLTERRWSRKEADLRGEINSFWTDWVGDVDGTLKGYPGL